MEDEVFRLYDFHRGLSEIWIHFEIVLLNSIDIRVWLVSSKIYQNLIPKRHCKFNSAEKGPG